MLLWLLLWWRRSWWLRRVWRAVTASLRSKWLCHRHWRISRWWVTIHMRRRWTWWHSISRHWLAHVWGSRWTHVRWHTWMHVSWRWHRSWWTIRHIWTSPVHWLLLHMRRQLVWWSWTSLFLLLNRNTIHNRPHPPFAISLNLSEGMML